jgi:hypothetical protein
MYISSCPNLEKKLVMRKALGGSNEKKELKGILKKNTQ